MTTHEKKISLEEERIWDAVETCEGCHQKKVNQVQFRIGNRGPLKKRCMQCIEREAARDW